MRISNVTIYSNEVETASLALSLSELDYDKKYLVKAITGIDAEELVPKFYGFGLNNVSPLNTKPRYYDFSMKPRNVVIRMALNPNFKLDETYAEVRDELYRNISSNRTGSIIMHFNYGATTVARLTGFITKFEVSHFTQVPEAQITINCPDPMFRGVNPVVYKLTGHNVLPTTNPVNIADSLSTAPHGFNFQVKFTENEPSFTIADRSTVPNWRFKVIPDGGFLDNDMLYFSSDYTNKYVYLIRGSTTIQLADRVNPGSIWPVIFPGGSVFWFEELDHLEWVVLNYYPAYWGV
jgi:hypothetical protein